MSNYSNPNLIESSWMGYTHQQKRENIAEG